MSDRLDYRFQDGVATITLDDGKVNVMSAAMLREIDLAFDRAEEERAIVVLRSGPVLRGLRSQGLRGGGPLGQLGDGEGGR